MRSRFPLTVLRAWEAAASFPRPLRDAALLACLEEPDAVPLDGFARLPIGERDAALLAWRQRLFGPEIRALVECPRCGQSLELSFTVPPDSPPRAPGAHQALPEHARHLELENVALDFRLLDTYDLAAVLEERDVVAARAGLLRRCVLQAQGLDGTAIAAWDLPDHVVDELSSRVSDLDPLADVQLSAVCEGCGHEWDAGFDVGQFLWSEIEADARGLLVDVHDLALAYGWSEREVLELSPERRQAYLELVRG